MSARSNRSLLQTVLFWTYQVMDSNLKFAQMDPDWHEALVQPTIAPSKLCNEHYIHQFLYLQQNYLPFQCPFILLEMHNHLALLYIVTKWCPCCSQSYINTIHTNTSVAVFISSINWRRAYNQFVLDPCTHGQLMLVEPKVLVRLSQFIPCQLQIAKP